MSSVRTFDMDFAEICAMEGPLHERLKALTDIIATHDPEFATAYQDLIRQLLRAETGAGAPETGTRMPPFLLPDHTGRLVSLESLLGENLAVISFNRGHWCEYCDVELRAYAAAHSEFSKSGAHVVSIMPDRLEYLGNVSERNNHAFSVLCDLDSSYALQLNLVIWLGERIEKLLSAAGVSLEKVQGNALGFVPVPATFVLDASGTILARFVDPDFRNRMEISDVLRVIATQQGRTT
jgi:peroxiredoxin